MQEAVSSTKYAVGFLKLVFKMSSSRLSLEAEAKEGHHQSFSGESEDKLFQGERSCEVSPKNVLDLASDRAFEEDFGSREQEEEEEDRSLPEEGGRSLLELSGGSDANVSQRRKKKDHQGRISFLNVLYGNLLPV